jgi:hypothetical protein
MVKKKIAMGARFFANVQTGPGAHSAYCNDGYRVFPGRGVVLTTHPLLAPRLRIE